MPRPTDSLDKAADAILMAVPPDAVCTDSPVRGSETLMRFARVAETLDRVRPRSTDDFIHPLPHPG